MQNEEHLIYGYNFRNLGGENNTYAFETINGIVYEVSFKPIFYFFEEMFPLRKETFEMSIVVTDKSRPAPFDNATGLTIAAILNHFYQRSSFTTTIYICDGSDRRELTRHRRFDSWFSIYNKVGRFQKIDFE